MNARRRAPRVATVLVVEPDAGHAALIADELSGADTDVRHVADGAAALDYLEGRGAFADPAACPRPQLIMIELPLPRVCGFDVLRAIRTNAELQTVPVVVLSGTSAAADVLRAYAEKANSFVPKPGDPAALCGLVRAIKDYWLHRNEPPWRSPYQGYPG